LSPLIQVRDVRTTAALQSSSRIRSRLLFDRHGVEYVVVGGVAAVLQGAPVTTFDIDALVKIDAANADRLLRVLEALEARYREHGTLRPTREDLLAGGYLLLMTNSGRSTFLASSATASATRMSQLQRRRFRWAICPSACSGSKRSSRTRGRSGAIKTWLLLGCSMRCCAAAAKRGRLFDRSKPRTPEPTSAERLLLRAEQITRIRIR
jgi:hypothetical protein